VNRKILIRFGQIVALGAMALPGLSDAVQGLGRSASAVRRESATRRA
jgi:hypothetical protein